MKQQLKIAIKIIREEIEKYGMELIAIKLFGSRAKGNYNKDSDWDFYIIVDKEINFPEKRKIIRSIKRRLINHNIPNDILIHSLSTVNERKNDVGYLTYYILKEGIDIL